MCDRMCSCSLPLVGVNVNIDDAVCNKLNRIAEPQNSNQYWPMCVCVVHSYYKFLSVYLNMMLSTAECSEFRQRIDDGSVDITYQSNVASIFFKSNRNHGNWIVSCKIVIKWLFSRTFGSYESFTNINNNVDKMFVRVARSHWLILLYSHGVQFTRKKMWPKNEWQSGRYCNWPKQTHHR